jgi:hypothetical protein
VSGKQRRPGSIGADSANSGQRKTEFGGTGVEDRDLGGDGARKTWGMVAYPVLIVNYFLSLLHTYSNGDALVRRRVAEVERAEGVGGIETIW